MDVSGGLQLVQTILATLGSPIWREIDSILGVESQLVKLKETISTIQAVLLGADQEELHQQQRRSDLERYRLQRLNDALYKADDLFDEIATVKCRKNLMSSNKVSRELCLFFSSSNQLYSAYIWSKEMKNIRKILDKIVKDHQHEVVPRKSVTLETWRMVRHDPRETHSLCSESDIIGREDDKKKVIDMLLSSTSVEKNVSVISIVGIGGLGKTSLAQLVYNDAIIQTEFPLRMWVCVSDDFNVGALLQQIIAAARKDEKELNMLSMDRLQSSLGEVLNGKKYLLVLDDIWNEDYCKWDDLSVLLEKGGSGSKILVTTRSNRVANIVGSRKIHELGGLSEDDSWKLFERIAFEGENNQNEDDLVKIGKEIICKCKNVPLAIRVVGSLLRRQDTRTWEYIKNTDLVNIKQDDNGILPVLKISYYHLPFHLKSCFKYCAVFPKDYKIMKDDLIHMWMALGFVMPLDGQSLEDAGDEYFNHLLQRCFFQDVEKDSYGGIKSCKMHDLIHDVAKEVAGTEILSSNNSTNHFNEKTRHSFLDRNTIEGSDDIVSSFNKMKRMRSLLKKVPSMIGQLIHLRYLDLSYNEDLNMLPESITKLYNLQTLKLHGCSGLNTLPRDLSKLVNLRDLDIFNCRSLRYMPPGMNKMTSLHKLTGFVISGKRKTSTWGSGCVGKLEDLENFTNHADILQILVRKFVRCDAFEAKICGNLLSKHLRKIKIIWRDDNDDSEENTNAKVSLQGLESCHNLSKIYLEGILRLEHLPPLHHLRHLKFLTLFGLRDLKFVQSSDISEDGAPTASGNTEELVFFPSLERLWLEDLPKLKRWWKTTSESDLGKVEAQYNQFTTTGMHFNTYSFPRLTQLGICKCPFLTAIPRCPNLDYINLKTNGAFSEYKIGWSSDANLFSTCHDSINRRSVIDDAGYFNFVSFHRLSHLSISFYKITESFPSGKVFQSDRLCFVRSLDINYCWKLKRLSWEGFWDYCTALETLCLSHNHELELEDVEEEEEDNNNSNKHGDEGEIRKEVTPWRFLSSLRDLKLDDLPKLKKLPNGMRHLTSLQSLKIKNCKNLKSMSEVMRHLTSLQQLSLISNSAELNARCKEPSGADWPNIQHISNIKIRVYNNTIYTSV
ncbi:disease resistance protein RGA2-like isoform X2 [Amaranthus tricolor]|uniref:disease resistance protein RGA2-like isoform X2 n=1 Tax=Amaranthus tricolor TaxID=29722 RepID=UPI002587ED0F|nr:disease resistance protein RGA2-like isoform X2 [Amaranthus tricolor]